MRNLLNFLFNYGYWILFLLLEIISFMLLFRFNSYQGSVGFTSANWVAGHIYTASANVSSFFKLHTINTQLTQRNIELQAENKALRETLQTLMPDSTLDALSHSLDKLGYTAYPCQVINNSLNRPDNYITLNKGAADGVKPEMGVVDGNGIIGIIYLTSEHYSLAISLLNSKSSISCKFKQNDYFGYLKWKGRDSQFAYLEDLPRHALFQKGDTIVTSGHSAVFPKDLMVGTVDSISDSRDGLSYLLRIRLSTDFANLNDAVIISNKHQKEQHTLEEKAIQEQ
ncbi:MAG: rod shape-determining protein MreC [Bacteroidaceae bacterium]|nr:rod shape-determining protein MreC [Bacteroidaceae bacterium]MBQ6801184.1 rod shape-determining protein MreC [Bacteroidaceae bacterium]MBQ8191271.1 rod shape-determining protein MreC [Bacteroidaceae bacterium]